MRFHRCAAGRVSHCFSEVPSTSFQVLFQRFLDGRVLGKLGPGILCKTHVDAFGCRNLSLPPGIQPRVGGFLEKLLAHLAGLLNKTSAPAVIKTSKEWNPCKGLHVAHRRLPAQGHIYPVHRAPELHEPCLTRR